MSCFHMGRDSDGIDEQLLMMLSVKIWMDLFSRFWSVWWSDEDYDMYLFMIDHIL